MPKSRTRPGARARLHARRRREAAETAARLRQTRRRVALQADIIDRALALGMTELAETVAEAAITRGNR